MSVIPDGVPCKHPGCLNHVSHPCEGCGRVGGKSLSVIELLQQSFLGVYDIYKHQDGSAMPRRYNERAETELLSLAKLGERMQWIPITEREPEDGQIVDVWDKELERVVGVRYKASEKCFYETFFPEVVTDLDDITHWRLSDDDRPEPPKEERP